jgi:peptide/nickel transport system permease protein
MRTPLTDAAPATTGWRLAWQRFCKHRAAIAGLVVFALIAASAVLAPWLTPYDINHLDPDHSLQPPSAAHLLGTDDLGRDELARLLYGGRVSLLVGVTVMLVGTTIGVAYGAVSGYFGGWVDALLMRFVDLMLSFPAIFLLLTLISLRHGRSSVPLMVAYLGSFGWMGLARIVRGEFLSLKTREYVQSARSVGASHLSIIFRHILPNAMAPVLVSAAFHVAGAMLAEAALDFLGFGLPPTVPTWGNLLTQAENYITTNPVLAIAPGLMITVAVVSIFFIGDALRDALDARAGTGRGWIG